MMRLLLAFVVLARVASYPQHPQPVDAQRHPWQSTICFADVSQSAYSLGETATLLNAAVIVCPNSTTQTEKAICSAALGNMMAALMYVLNYGMAAFTDCIDTTDVSTVDTGCAADVTGFLNGLVTAWGAYSSIAAGTCRGNASDGAAQGGVVDRRRLDEVKLARPAAAPRPSAPLLERARRAAEAAQQEQRERGRPEALDARDLPEYNQYRFLRGSVPDYDQLIRDMHHVLNLHRTGGRKHPRGDDGEEAEEPVANASDLSVFDAHRIRDTEVSFCVLDVGQLTFYLTRAVATMHYSVQNCEPSKLVSSEGRMTCTVNVAGLIGALLYVAFYITVSTFHCPAPNNLDAVCAADIVAALTVFTSLISAGANLPLSCGALEPNDIFAGNNRRLGVLV